MKFFKQLLRIAILICLGAGFGNLAHAELVIDRDYKLLSPQQPTDSGNKVEVLEFFWYGCPHCYHLQPSLDAWLKRKPADVAFKTIPGTFGNAAWEPLTRTWYALNALGLADKYHDALFKAIHENPDAAQKKALVTDSNAIADWLAAHGVDKQKFLDAYRSFTVAAQYQRSVDMTQAYNIEGTPTLVIDGKYVIEPSMEGYANGMNIDYDRFWRNVNLLIAQARKAHGK